MHTRDFAPDGTVRHNWTTDEINAVYALPFNDLLFRAQSVHRQNFDPNTIQTASLLSIKTGGCPEDCGYCAQSARYKTGVAATPLLSLDEVLANAKSAKALGATRFCMGAAWRSPNEKNLETVCTMVSAVKDLGMETCVTLGMLTAPQAHKLADAGLDFYNHNVDTSEEFYPSITTTRTYRDRLDTLEHVREAGMQVCCGGIIGMGERIADRLAMLRTLANLPEHPQSLPINLWNEVDGVPVGEKAERPDAISIVRLIATARIMMPTSFVRLAAGRQYMSDELHALCFLAGANSLFLGDVLLTTANPSGNSDHALFERLDIRIAAPEEMRIPAPVSA